MNSYLWREYNNMREVGLDPGKEADKLWWANNYESIQAYKAAGHSYKQIAAIIKQ